MLLCTHCADIIDALKLYVCNERSANRTACMFIQYNYSNTYTQIFLHFTPKERRKQNTERE